jgi:hypothetical protein
MGLTCTALQGEVCKSLANGKQETMDIFCALPTLEQDILRLRGP